MFNHLLYGEALLTIPWAVVVTVTVVVEALDPFSVTTLGDVLSLSSYQCTTTLSCVGGAGALEDPLQVGKLVLFVYGETTTQACGCGGTKGGGKFVETG